MKRAPIAIPPPRISSAPDIARFPALGLHGADRADAAGDGHFRIEHGAERSGEVDDGGAEMA